MYNHDDAVKCNLTKLTKSAVSVLVSMVSDFWHTSVCMAIVGQRLLVFEHAQTTGMHCSEILLDLGLIIGKFVMAGLQGTASHESGMFVWGLALEVEAPG